MADAERSSHSTHAQVREDAQLPIGAAFCICVLVLWSYFYKGYHDVALLASLLVTLGRALETRLRRDSNQSEDETQAETRT